MNAFRLEGHYPGSLTPPPSLAEAHDYMMCAEEVFTWLTGLLLRSVKSYLHGIQAHGLEVRFGIIFGSQVSGKTGELSDIDLLVVSPRFDAPRKRQGVDLLWRMQFASTAV